MSLSFAERTSGVDGVCSPAETVSTWPLLFVESNDGVDGESATESEAGFEDLDRFFSLSFLGFDVDFFPDLGVEVSWMKSLP